MDLKKPFTKYHQASWTYSSYGNGSMAVGYDQVLPDPPDTDRFSSHRNKIF